MNIINWINPIYTIKQWFYIFQLLDYDIYIFPLYYIKLITKGIKEKRSRLQYTVKVKLMLMLSLFVDLLHIILLYTLSPITILFYLLIYRIIPIGIIISFFLSFFSLSIFEKILILQTRNYVKKLNPNLKVIGITGSFGKSTTKNIIYQILSKYKRSQIIEGNINTTLGIINWVKRNLKDNTEFLVVEMGAYRENEIKKSCQVLQPNYAIITSIGEQHLERYKSLENIIKTKLEIFRYSLLDSYKYTTSKVKDLISKTYKHDNINIVVNTDKYSDDNKLLASRVLEDIGIETRFINKDIEDIKLPDRRKNLTNMQDFRVLDDSYNINPLSAKITIETALNSNYKNVVAIVGGIPEAGVKTKEFNYNLGYELNKVTHVYVLKSDFHKYIIEKLENDKYSLVNNIDEAWNQVIKNEDKSNTLVIHFPELTDLYY